MPIRLIFVTTALIDGATELNTKGWQREEQAGHCPKGVP